MPPAIASILCLDASLAPAHSIVGTVGVVGERQFHFKEVRSYFSSCSICPSRCALIFNNPSNPDPRKPADNPSASFRLALTPIGSTVVCCHFIFLKTTEKRRCSRFY